MYLSSTVSIHGHSSPYLNFNETDFYNIGISMISILMIDISKIFAGWISSWEENDLGGFCLGRKQTLTRTGFRSVCPEMDSYTFTALFLVEIFQNVVLSILLLHVLL